MKLAARTRVGLYEIAAPARGRMKLLARLTAVALSAAVAFGSDCRSADLAVKNAHVVTMDDARRTVSAFAVRDGKFVAVGTAKDIATCIDKHTHVLDLQRRTVLPGFIDVHTHAISWAKGIVRGDIEAGYPKVRSIAEITTAVAERVKTLAPGQWVLGFGWDDTKLNERRYLHRRDLDRVAPDVPVYLSHVSGHLGAANSTALRIAGIDRNTPDPAGGVIDHDANGEPTGIVKDNAMRLVESKKPSDPSELSAHAARFVSGQAAAAGLTTIHDVWPAAPFADDMRGYQDAYRNGWLKIRVQLAPGVATLADAERLAASGLHTGFGDDRLKLGAIKMFADGGMGARTIAIYPPGLKEGDKENLGLLIWKPEDMKKAQLMLAKAGWQISTHAIGDRAIGEVLDSYSAVTKELGLKDTRFRIIHAGVSTPAILKRFRDEHVLVDSNPAFVYWIGSWFQKYGPARTRWSYPGKSYFDYKVIAAAASDVPVTPISPWWGLWAAVERRELNTGQVIAPEERLSVLKALEMFTRNPAYIGSEEKKKGSIEVGKLADFIVIDRDVLSLPPGELKEIRVLSTYVGGELVYENR